MGCWSLDLLDDDEFIVRMERYVGDDAEKYLIAQRLDDGHLFYAGYPDNEMAAIIAKTPIVFATAYHDGTNIIVNRVLEDRNVKYYQIDLAFDIMNGA